MGVYYHLFNNTKKEKVHFDDCIKRSPILNSPLIHKAIMIYMVENEGDNFQFLGDGSGDISWEQAEYKEVDLKYYNYKTEGANEMIKMALTYLK